MAVAKLDKRKPRSYKIKDSVYIEAMRKCAKGTPLANRVEVFVEGIAKSNKK